MRPSITGKYLGWIEGLLLAVVLLPAGCRTFPLPKPHVDDVAAERQDREATVIENFERRRTFAEFEAAKAAWERNDLANSQAALESILQRVPQHRDARLLLSKVHFEQDHPQEAVAQLQTALVDFPNDPGVHKAVSNLMAALNQNEDAQAHADCAAQLAGERDQAVASMATQGENPLFASQKTGPSPLNPHNPVVPVSGTMASEPHGVHAGFDDSINSTAQLGTIALLEQAEDALADGNTDQALADFRRAATLEPNNPRIPTAATIAALRQSRPDVAITLAHEALVSFPQSLPLLRSLGTAYYRQGDYPSSQLVLQQALSLDKSDALAYFLLGCTCAKLDQPEAAKTCFAEAERLDPSLSVRHSN